ncbi:MAG: uroporphyrinogen-III C-methyltransferase [Coprococcus sp.]
MTGMVYLIGAGPGDAGLITVKGLEALRRADVIVYDHLASESLLNETRPEAEWINAGKYAGNHRMKQGEIEQVLIERAKQGLQVARLKGGDPFIFGRGGEEALALSAAGIPFIVIPGVSSSYAAAAYAGIPVTHRRVASSFHVITGHEDPTKESSSLDYETLAREEGTLVFLMGLSRIRDICRMLIEHGKDPFTPSAVIASGTTARQQCIIAPLNEIADKTEKDGIRPPAILLVGNVAGLQPQVEWKKRGPLTGQRILVTATKAMAGRLGQLISSLGGEPVLLSLIEVRLIENLNIKPVLSQAPAGGWIVFTSRNGVQMFFEQMKNEQVDIRLLGDKKIAAMGSGTKRALEDYGYYADLIPEQSCSESLAEALCREIVQNRTDEQTAEQPKVLMFRAQEASGVLCTALDRAGIHYVDIPLYVTERQWKKAGLLNQILENVDVVTFCSASAVDAFHAMTKGQEIKGKTICIGPVTAKAACERGIRVDGQAEKYDLGGLIQCMCDKIYEK